MARVARNAIDLAEGWELAASDAGAYERPSRVEAAFRPARATTVAAALGMTVEDAIDLDARDWWFRRKIGRGETGDVLRFGGLATLADVFVDDELVLRSEDMFVEHALDAARVREGSVVAVRFGSLARALAERRPRPRWRATIVEQQQLRWFRTSLLGRIPSWTPPIAPVGFTGRVAVERRRAMDVTVARASARLEGEDGIVEASLELHGPVREAELVVGERHARLRVLGTAASGSVVVPRAPRWWPHTHGAPALVPVSVVLRGAAGEERISLGRTGFRALRVDRDDGAFTVHVNGVRTFCRGACWMPLDVVSLAEPPDTLRATLLRARDAGMNMIRVSGTMIYEPQAFHDLCDELGILVWQDFMFANMDYPVADERFAASVRREAEELVHRLELSPSLAVCCGGSEVEQQAAMLGLPAGEWSSPLFDELLPSVVASARPDVAWVSSSPTGGALPFDVDAGVAHYYGVGAYMRPLEDARRARVRFTSECLAFANLPCDETIERLLRNGESPGADPRWKRRVARDRGTAWDFDDVRDHYVRRLFGVDPEALRRADVTRYLELGRVATGEAMAAAMSEWRRRGSECAGAIVWFLRDLWDGAGFGVIDARGVPKSSYYYLRRVLAPVALLAIDEGCNGLALHAINDGDAPLAGVLRVVAYRGERAVAEGELPVIVPPHDALETRAHAVIGRFIDETYAFRFGPPAHDAIVATLVDGAGAVVARAFHHTLGLRDERVSDLGVEASAERVDASSWRLVVRARKTARAVAVDARGFVPDDDFFDLAPGEPWTTVLRGDARTLAGFVRPLHATAPTRIEVKP